MEDDVRENVKQAASGDAAEQTIVKIDVPQGLTAKIQVEEEEDLETILANLELLARRKGFNVEALNRSVDREGIEQPLSEADKDLLGWLEQLDEGLGSVEDHLQALDKRVNRVEDELGGGEDSQLAQVMDQLRRLEEEIEDLPEDVSRHLGELREEITSLSEEVEGLYSYTSSLEDDIEALRQRLDEEKKDSSEQTEEEDVDENGIHYSSVSDFRDLEKEAREREVKTVIEEEGPVDTHRICEVIFGLQPETDDKHYIAIQDQIQQLTDEIEKENHGRKVLYKMPGDELEEEQQEEASTEESGEDGLFKSLASFRKLSTEQREDEIRKVIQVNQPIGTSGICKVLFGHEANSGTDEYAEVQNRLQSFRDSLEKEEHGHTVKYRLTEEKNSDSQQPVEEEAESTKIDSSETEEDEDFMSSEDLEEARELRRERKQEQSQSTSEKEDEDRPDFSDHDGRYSLEELREDDDLSVEAEVLKVFQEYRKGHGPISIPEATKVLFGSEASEEDDEFQAVWNQLETHSRKDGNRLERIEKEQEEDQFKIFGPFKYCNLYSDSHHSIICAECPPSEDAIFRDRDEAATHLGETGKADGKKRHNAFVSAQLPQSSWYRNTKLIKKVVDRECGNQ